MQSSPFSFLNSRSLDHDLDSNRMSIPNTYDLPDKYNHHIYYTGTEDNWNTMQQPAALRANFFGNLAIDYLQNGDCNAAAFCLGVMVHYIADMSCYLHVNEFMTHEGIFSAYEPIVCERSDCKDGLAADGATYAWGRHNEYFDIDNIYASIHSELTFLSYPMGPDHCARMAGAKTYFGGDVETYDGVYDTLSSWSMDFVYEDDSMSSTRNWGINRDWVYILAGTNRYMFVKSLECHLQYTMQCMATALDYVNCTTGDWECSKGGEVQTSMDDFLRGNNNRGQLKFEMMMVLVGIPISFSALIMEPIIKKIYELYRVG